MCIAPEINHIYLGDCLEITKEWPDKCVDIVLSDPPYGMNYYSNHHEKGNPYSKILNDDKYPLEMLKESFRLAKRAVLFFCRWDNFIEIPKPKSLICWVKDNWTAGDLKHAYGRQYEMCAFYPMEQHEFIYRPSDVIHCGRITSIATVRKHPTEKPVPLMAKLLRPLVGNIVLDPFCGVGSTLVAALQEGRQYIGIELDPKYCEIAEKRVKAPISLDLF